MPAAAYWTTLLQPQGQHRHAAVPLQAVQRQRGRRQLEHDAEPAARDLVDRPVWNGSGPASLYALQVGRLPSPTPTSCRRPALADSDRDAVAHADPDAAPADPHTDADLHAGADAGADADSFADAHSGSGSADGANGVFL